MTIVKVVPPLLPFILHQRKKQSIRTLWLQSQISNEGINKRLQSQTKASTNEGIALHELTNDVNRCIPNNFGTAGGKSTYINISCIVTASHASIVVADSIQPIIVGNLLASVADIL